MKYRWQIPEQEVLKARQLAFELSVSPLLAQILLQRKLGNPLLARAFLEPRLQQLADPFLLPQMDLAVSRLWQARAVGEPVVIFGDYDVDGVTASALLYTLLSDLGWKVHVYLPNRFDEGYGLSEEAIFNCLEKFPTKLLLAVDCGSTSVQVIQGLKLRGVDVVVLDHHQVSNPPPPAVALVNPQLRSEDEPDFRELCSAGLAFKLSHALVKKGREMELKGTLEYDIRPLLEWVALGTIADLVPLTGENRIMVSVGLQRLNQTKRPGLLALKTVAGCKEIGTYEVGFQLGPRLNAAGRLETAEEALQLLLSDNVAKATQIAKNLDTRNRERQAIEKSITDQVFSRIRDAFDPENDFVIVEGHQPWHVGVVGIVASRVLQEFYRPTIIVGGDTLGWRGSGRSIEGFDLAAALRECSHLLERHGGHAMAAGVSLKEANLLEFKKSLNEVARSRLRKEQFQPPLRIDAEIELRHLTLSAMSELDLLKPTGMGNPAVQLVARNLAIQRPPTPIGSDKQHLKFAITDGFQILDVVWWNGARQRPPEGKFNLAFAPQVNEYMGRKTIQLKFLDWEPS